MNGCAAIFGCSGPGISPSERAFFREAAPWGFILFARNCENPAQIRRLVSELQDILGREAPVLIDQEGGRVARLKPPHWRCYPPARRYGELYAADPADGLEAARLGGLLIGAELAALGINVDCLPVLDVPAPGAHDIIGDRAYAADPAVVAALGRAAAEGLMAARVLPVIKHVPGHGRAGADSHENLPIVATCADELRRTDFAPFKALADLPMAMTAHVIYQAFDAERPATISPVMVGDIIRGEIGFNGLLMTDDLSMKALQGSLEARTEASFDAGCDVVLHCNGELAEMSAIAKAARPLSGAAARRAQAVENLFGPADPFDEAEALARFSALTGTGL